MSDHINSPRFLIAFILLLLVSAASIYGAVSGISSAASSATTTDTTTNDYLFLKLFTTSGSSIPAFASFMAFLGQFV